MMQFYFGSKKLEWNFILLSHKSHREIFSNEIDSVGMIDVCYIYNATTNSMSTAKLYSRIHRPYSLMKGKKEQMKYKTKFFLDVSMKETHKNKERKKMFR